MVLSSYSFARSFPTRPRLGRRGDALCALSLALLAPAPLAEQQQTNPPTPPKATVGVFARTGNYFRLSRTHQGAGSLQRRFHFLEHNVPGSPVGLPYGLAGDFNQDGFDSVALFEQETGTFYYSNRNAFDSVVLSTKIVDAQGDAIVGTPVAGDWDGNDVDTFGIYIPESGLFLLRDSLVQGQATLVFNVAVAPGSSEHVTGGVPLAGDFDGDGYDEVGIYQPDSGEFFLADMASLGAVASSFTFGPGGGLPLAGDWDNDGDDTIGVFRPAGAQCLLRNANSSGPEDHDVPVVTESHTQWSGIAGRWDNQGSTGESAPYAWPTVGPADAGFNVSLLTLAYADAASSDSMHSLLVFKGGNLVAEQYFKGFDATMANNIKSVSKSVLSALVGIAMADPAAAPLQLEDKVKTHLPAYTYPELTAGMRVGHLLTMKTGIGWDEDDLFINWWNAGLAGTSWVQYAIDPQQGLPTFAPGEVFNYSTANTHIGSALIQQVTGMTADDYADQKLWGPLGVEVQRWDRDPQGVAMGGSEVMMRPRDMGRFGLLYLNQGFIDGAEIVPTNWAQSSIQPVTFGLPGIQGGDNYGHWWRHRVQAGQDVFYAWGYGGQFVFIVPSLHLHVVATSRWNVDETTSSTNATTVFNIMKNRIVPAAIN